jgi:Na+/proline symporter
MKYKPSLIIIRVINIIFEMVICRYRENTNILRIFYSLVILIFEILYLKARFINGNNHFKIFIRRNFLIGISISQNSVFKSIN